MSPFLLVPLILGAVVLVQAAIWIPLISIWRKRRADFVANLQKEIAASGEKLLRGPEKGVYRGASNAYPAVKGNGQIWLTDKRLIFCKVTGSALEVAAPKIRGTHEAKIFLRSVVAGRMHLVVDTSDPAEIGFFVNDNAAWTRAISEIAAAI